MILRLPTVGFLPLTSLLAMLLTIPNPSALAQTPSIDAATLQSTVTVDVTKPTGRELTPELFGVAFPRSETHAENATAREQIAGLQAPFISLSLGGFGSVAETGPTQPLNWSRVDHSLEVVKAVHTGPLLVALGGPRTVVKGGWFDVANENHRQFWAGVVAEAAKRFAKAGLRAEWWELWNEPDGAWGKADTASFENLWKLYNTTAEALKSVDPFLKVGGPAIAWPYPEIIRRYLQECGPLIDFVSYHQYGTGRLDHPTHRFLTHTARQFGTEAGRVRRLVREELKDREIPIILTEYNMNYGWKPGEARQQTEVNAVFTTLALMQAHAQGLDMAAIWGAYGDAKFGLITPETGRIAPVGHALRQLSEWAPGASIETQVQRLEANEENAGSDPLHAFASVSADGKMCTVTLANISEETEVSAFVALRMETPRPIVACEQFEVGRNYPAGLVQEIPLVPQMMEITVPPMSVVIQRFTFNDSVR